MNRYIICHGFDAECQILLATDLETAQARAVEFSRAKGLGDDDLIDTTWARPFDVDLADVLGLMWLDEREKGWYTAEAVA